MAKSKPKSRIIWMKLHAYLACFFLPITLLYIFTGILSMFDIEGGLTTEYEYKIELSQPWPEPERPAKQIVAEILKKNGHERLPNSYFPYPQDKAHYWYDYKVEIGLLKLEADNEAKVIVKNHDVWHQFLLIHKGHGGPFFWLFGLFLGLSLIFSLVSGVVLVFKIPKFKKVSLYSILGGFFTIIFFYLF